MTAFLRQSGSNDLFQLHTLELLYVPLTSNGVVDILGELLYLKELKLKTSPSDRRNYFDETLRILRKEYEKRRLPRFHTLIIDVPSGAVTRYAFFEFVASQANLKLACLEYVGNNDREARAPHFFAQVSGTSAQWAVWDRQCWSSIFSIVVSDKNNQIWPLGSHLGII